MESKNIRISIFSALCIVINIVGSFLALALRLPIYLDTIGTILSALMFGPIIGLVTGGLTGIIVGFLFDPTSLYFIPVQLVLGFLTGIFFRKNSKNIFLSALKILIITLICSCISSLISTIVFSGVTSSGSAYFVSLLRLSGTNLFTSVFSVQFISDLADKFISFWICFLIIKFLPERFKTISNNI